MERGLTLAIVAASFLWTGFLGIAAPAQEPAAKDDGPEDRLLRAQLLEVSTGDIEKAKTIYQAIQGDEKAPESTRALALLYLARCHRKMGEIDSARKVLDELVRTHEKQRDVIRQARSFLRELTSGKPESPDFDWLKELERSPEIQARVFDLAMDLTERPSDAGNRAWRQLLALGTIGVPVIEKVLESTRSPAHRQQLALVLVRLGRFERLPIVLDPRFPPRSKEINDDLTSFQGMILTMEEDERARLRAELERLPSAETTDPYRDALLLAAGDRSALAQKLGRIERIGSSFLGSKLLEDLLKEEPSAIDVLLGRILDPGCKFKQDYFDAVLRRDSVRLALEHWVVVLSGVGDSGWDTYIGGIEDRGDFALLARLAALPGVEHHRNRQRLVSRFDSKFRRFLRGTVAQAPSSGWAAVLRAAAATVPEAGGSLRDFAEKNDEAIPGFVGLLRNLMKEAPLAPANIRNRESSGAPSQRLIEAMAGLLEIQDDDVKSIALAILQDAPKDTPDTVFEAVEDLWKKSENSFIRQFALSVLLRQLQAGRDIGPRLANAFIEEHERAIGEEQPATPAEVKETSQPQAKSVKRAPARPPLTLRGAAPPPPRPQGFRSFLLNYCHIDGRKTLYPHIVALVDSEAGSRFHDVYFRELTGEPMAAIAPQFARALESAKSKPFRESAVHLISDMRPSFPNEDVPRVLTFLRAVALDESLDVEDRLQAFIYADEPPFEWFDWEKLLGGSDLLAGSLFTYAGVPLRLDFVVNIPSNPAQKRNALPSRLNEWLKAKPDAERERIFQAALGSPQSLVRRFAVMAYSTDRPGALVFLRRGLGDDDGSVRTQAIEQLKRTTRGDLAPLAVELLKNPDREMRLSGIELQKRFLAPEAIEPLAALLSDSDVEVRSKALEALREVRKAFEEKNEWELIRKGLRPSLLPAPKKDTPKKEQ